jgi:hypothetical protein
MPFFLAARQVVRAIICPRGLGSGPIGPNYTGAPCPAKMQICFEVLIAPFMPFVPGD